MITKFLLDTIVPKTLTLAEARTILTSHNYCAFLDTVETVHLEFKGEPYRLDHELQKQELAKDVSALANARGGAILIGFKTTKSPIVLGDLVTEVRPIPSDQFDAEQYYGVIREWIYPAPTVTIEWFPVPADKGIVLIEVGAGDPEHLPHLLKRTVSEDGRRSEVVFGYVERRQGSVPPASVQQIHALLRSGMRMHEIRDQYGLIQNTLQQLLDMQNGAFEAQTGQVNSERRISEFNRDKQQALAVSGFESIPNLLLAAYPTESVSMRGLFDSKESDLIQLLQDPPRLKGNGWDLTIDEPMLNLHGRMRRSVKPDWKLLQLSRDGVLIFLARGDDSFLSFSANQKPDGPFFIVPFVLSHCVYIFTLLAQRVFEYATPAPSTIRYVLQLRNMENKEHPALLHPNHLEMNRYAALEYYHQMPYASEGFEVSAPHEASPGEVTYELIAQVFEWFGFDRDRVRNVRVEADKAVIDEVSLFAQQP
jgi:hypothetical protein